jgi:glycosyltransferase involved in cell wall biosynthesis
MATQPTGSQPLVSIVIPAYNRAGIIRDTIANIFEQTYKNIELIIVDDGSADDTLQILQSYGSRIKWATQKNAGPSAARNHGIRLSTGEIIAFQDSDDAWHPSKIERQVSLLERGGDSVVCCLCNCTVQLPGIEVRSFENAPVDPPINEGLWLNPAEVLATRFMLFNQAVAVRRRFLEKIGGFDESFRLMEDMDLALKLSLEGPWAFIRDPLATRQDKLARTLGHEATPQICATNEVRIRETILQLVEKNENLSGLQPLMLKELKRARRRLRAVEFRDDRTPGASALGWGLQQFERYRQAVERRTPWFPKMKVQALRHA